MLYEITVIDTDEHPSDFGSNPKYDNAKRFGSFICEAPHYRTYTRDYGGDVRRSESRMPKAVIEFALDVSTQYLTYAQHGPIDTATGRIHGTVLVEIGYISPKRVGYAAGNTSWTQTGRMTAFLLNSEYLKRRDDANYLRILSIID